MNIVRCILIVGIALSLAANTLANTFPLSDLELTKIVDKPEALENEMVKFTVDVINNGPYTVHSVTVTDLLPAGLSYHDYDATLGSYSSGGGLWDVGTLSLSQSAALDLWAIVDPGTLGQTLSNTATVEGDVYDTNPDNNSMTAYVDVVPEPATLGLLVLGGLFLRRRR